MNEEPFASLPKPKLESLADHKFVLLLTSISLWVDVVLAMTSHKSLIQVQVEWTKEIPLGLSLVFLLSYGLCLNIILPDVAIFLKNLWTRIVELIKRIKNRGRPSYEFYPDRTHYIDAFDLELEAAHSGNTVLVSYAREHINSVMSGFREKEQYVFIGILLFVEVIAVDSALNQLTMTLSSSPRMMTRIFVLLMAILSLLQGARGQSLWAFYLRRPSQKPH